MDKKIKENHDKLLEVAKTSKNPTVQNALKKLLFTVSLAHNKEYIELENLMIYHSGCTITIPKRDHFTVIQLTWNNEKIQVYSEPYQVQTFNYGHLAKLPGVFPGITLKEEQNYK